MSLASTVRRAACALLGAAALAGCSVISDLNSTSDLYTLTPKSSFDADIPSVYWQLSVEVPSAAANINTGRIALAQSATSSDYFAKSGWTDRAPVMVQTLLVDSFENSKRIVAVSRDSIGLRADYILQTDLREFQAEYYHDKGPPIVRVRIATKLVRMPDRQIIGSGSFERCYRARENTVAGAVKAYDEALGSVLKRVVAWTLRTPPARPIGEGAPYAVDRFRNPASAANDSNGCPRFGQPGNTPVVEG
jgi:cholesterol transport system auxiliary component